MPFLFLTFLCAIAVPLGAQASGEAVIRAMHERYASSWYRTATYVQKTTLTQGKLETWYTAIQLPSRLRVDVGPSLTGRAMIFRSDSLYQFGAKKLRGASYYPNAILILTQDVHVEPPARTIERLRKLRFNLARTHETTWQGKPVIVVGALAGDSLSSQFWVEKDRMLLVRLIEVNAGDPSRPLDARFENYARAGGGWMEQRVTLLLGGQVVQQEEHTKIKTGMKQEEGLYDPATYRLPKWVGGADDVFGGMPSLPTMPGGRGGRGGGGGR
jgi:hypothetical protein